MSARKKRACRTGKVADNTRRARAGLQTQPCHRQTLVNKI